MADPVPPRRPLWGVLVVLALLFFAGSAYVVLPSIKIRRLHKAYESVERGMTQDEVRELMATRESADIDLRVDWYEWDLLPGEDIRRIKTNLHYQVKTAFLPVTFGFSFDEDGKLLGKHRYD
jgi:hypothetical protein